MKKMFYLLMFVFMIQACNPDCPPILDGKVPFIICKIEQYSITHSKYIANNNKACDAILRSAEPQIILLTGSYNIGDTISFLKLKFTKKTTKRHDSVQN